MYDEMPEDSRNFRNFDNICGEVLMHKRESSKVSEFLQQFKLGFDHGA